MAGLVESTPYLPETGGDKVQSEITAPTQGNIIDEVKPEDQNEDTITPEIVAQAEQQAEEKIVAEATNLPNINNQIA